MKIETHSCVAPVTPATSGVTTWRYHLASIKGEGWIVAFLDSIGCFSVLSDFGDYGHRWPQAGWGPGDFRKFFVQCDGDYILRKIARRDVYDGKETYEAIRRRICELRRNRHLSAVFARKEWEIVDRQDKVYSREDFAMWYERTGISDAYELAVYDFNPQAKTFIQLVLPRLQAAIRAEIEAEARGA
jgi:hypothetical protein